MKKYIYYILITLFILFNITSVKAETIITKTYGDRNNVENYGVVKRGINITDYNLPNILRTPYVDPSLKIYDYGEILNNDEKETI